MPAGDVEKYVVRHPLYEPIKAPDGGQLSVKNRQTPPMTLMSSNQVAESNYHLEIGWIYGLPDPNPYGYEHTHEHDEIEIFWGGDYKTPQNLGAEIEFYLGGQPIRFNTTTALYIPKGISHGPVTWKSFRFPHVEMALKLGSGRREETSNTGRDLPSKKVDFDFEQYVVRSPVREAGDIFKAGRQTPTMTYMSHAQVNIANIYIEFGWIWGIVEPPISEMRHDRYDEIVLHLGGDPWHPEDLGANMNFGLNGELLEYTKSYCVFIPKGVKHGPLRWNSVTKPHIEMAIMLGCGNCKDAWADSFLS